jgi:hypothetical protein
MKNHVLNAELVSNKKFTPGEIKSLKEKMDLNEDYLVLYAIFMESMGTNFNGCLEIYVEDVELEYDLLETIEKMLIDLDELTPGGLSNDSKLEWSSGVPLMNTVWYKDNNKWIERASESEREFYGGNSWEDDDYDNTLGGYNDYDQGLEDTNW